MAEIGVESLNLDMKQVNARIVSQCHDRGLKVFVYTVNKLQDVLRLKKIGVDGVFTNFPELERYG